MRYLAIDFGKKRIGLSFADELGVAFPIDPIKADALQEQIHGIQSVIEERSVTDLVVGYPYNMDGTIGTRAQEVDIFIEHLVAASKLPVHRVDERLTSYQAEQDTRSMGGKKKHSLKAKKAERASGKLDSQAATLILQDFLDSL